jgi:6-pyruvoyltetrahydropterin/6-carboxytetrahydropterin synthase
MPFEISTEAGFSAAHYIEGYPGDCARLHGHNWRVRVTLRAHARRSDGLTYDFRKLRRLIEAVVGMLDHSILNDLECLKGRNPTAEVIAEWAFGEVRGRLEGGSVDVARVEVWESPLSCAAYIGE